jgi:hypothetical protein
MREYGISLRNKSRARKLALRQRKVTAMRFDAAGQRHDIMYHKIDVNERFFNSWSREMAYVLGIIYTDGNLQAPKKMNTNKRDYSRVARVSIGQKEPEILQKILRLMSCNAKLYFSPQREYKNAVAGKLYYISIGSNQLYDALSRIGLKPKKSRDIRFPDMPEECVRHFIRGCWDGDGSVYIECRQDRLVASYVCGSYAFIEDLLVHLEKAGLPKRNIYETKRGERASYYFKYSGRQCNQLYHYLYDDVPPAQYLERKYLLFKKYCDRSLNQSQLFRQAD